MSLLSRIFKSGSRMTPAGREAVRAYLRERMRVWMPEEQEPFTKCADIMLYYQQFRDSPEIVGAWMAPATKHMHQAISTWLQRADELTVPEEAMVNHQLWQEIFKSGERWAEEMAVCVQLNASGVPLGAQSESRKVSGLYEEHKKAQLRSERETQKLIKRFAVVVD